jgi:hypothetical protein
MGAPSQQQIDEALADGLARGEPEEVLAERLASLERLTDEELAEFGVFERVDRTQPPAPIRRAEAQIDATAFNPAPTRNGNGWTADRQRLFLETLAESGCVSEACGAVNLSASSAYRLRHKPGAESFSAAWANAETLAATRLTALAFERAVHGKSEYLFKDGVLVAERRTPSDRLLMWLIGHLDPVGFGRLANRVVSSGIGNPQNYAAARLPELLGELADVADADCPIEWAGAEHVAENEPVERA